MARIVGTATQGSADAFVEASIQTALQGQTKNAYKITAVTYEFAVPNVFNAGGGAANDVELCLTRRTKTAMPDIDDVDVIKKWKFGSVALTGVGQIVQPPLIGIWVPELETIIVEDPIYMQLDSTATTVTITANLAIEYELVQISEVDRLTLLTQSLV
jgi:hypothetical protein